MEIPPSSLNSPKQQASKAHHKLESLVANTFSFTNEQTSYKIDKLRVQAILEDQDERKIQHKSFLGLESYYISSKSYNKSHLGILLSHGILEREEKNLLEESLENFANHLEEEAQTEIYIHSQIDSYYLFFSFETEKSGEIFSEIKSNFPKDLAGKLALFWLSDFSQEESEHSLKSSFSDFQRENIYSNPHPCPLAQDKSIACSWDIQTEEKACSKMSMESFLRYLFCQSSSSLKAILVKEELIYNLDLRLIPQENSWKLFLSFLLQPKGEDRKTKVMQSLFSYLNKLRDHSLLNQTCFQNFQALELIESSHYSERSIRKSLEKFLQHPRSKLVIKSFYPQVVYDILDQLKASTLFIDGDFPEKDPKSWEKAPPLSIPNPNLAPSYLAKNIPQIVKEDNHILLEQKTKGFEMLFISQRKEKGSYAFLNLSLQNKLKKPFHRLASAIIPALIFQQFQASKQRVLEAGLRVELRPMPLNLEIQLEGLFSSLAPVLQDFAKNLQNYVQSPQFNSEVQKLIKITEEGYQKNYKQPLDLAMEETALVAKELASNASCIDLLKRPASLSSEIYKIMSKLREHLLTKIVLKGNFTKEEAASLRQKLLAYLGSEGSEVKPKPALKSLSKQISTKRSGEALVFSLAYPLDPKSIFVRKFLHKLFQVLFPEEKILYLNNFEPLFSSLIFKENSEEKVEKLLEVFLQRIRKDNQVAPLFEEEKSEQIFKLRELLEKDPKTIYKNFFGEFSPSEQIKALELFSYPSFLEFCHSFLHKQNKISLAISASAEKKQP